MKAKEILIAMHLLLANKTFSPENLKELLENDCYNPGTPMIQQLKSMHDAYVNEGKLISDSMLSYFPSKQIVMRGDQQVTMDMLDFAAELEKSEHDDYCVHAVAENLGQLLCLAYNLQGYDEALLDDAIMQADPIELRELTDDLKKIQWQKFIDLSFKFADAFIKELNYIKRNERARVIDPGYIFRNAEEEKLGRVIRATSYTRFSLESLGQFLAILYPVMTIIMSEDVPEVADFMNFIYDLRLIELVEHYCCEAREQYGSPTSVNVLKIMMQDEPSQYFDPEDEPEDDESHNRLADFWDLIPEIAAGLYGEFYT